MRFKQGLKVAGMVTTLSATVLILCNEFRGELAALRDGDRRLMDLIASVNPFVLVTLFVKGVADYARGCPALPSADCPGMTVSPSPLTAIVHGFEFVSAQTPAVPFKGVLVAAVFATSWLIGARMAKSSGSSGHFFWIVPGLIGLSVACFIVQAGLWLVAGSVFVVFAMLALIGGSISVVAILALKAITTASEGKKAVEITQALVSHRELEG